MKAELPKGTRDFSPEQVQKRNFIFDNIRAVFERYGFQPIETPAMEKLSTLTGKYGDEGDQLLFKILNNGDFLAKANENALDERNSKKLVPSISKRGLRYDLTVPFARFVVMNQNELTFPFKRYQIQPVWRGDRPSKGRYQEFYQCDVDIVGSDSLMNEAELVRIYDEVFTRLGIKVTIKVNNRKILAGIAEVAQIAEQMSDMTVAIDKLDKIGIEGVTKEMQNRGIPETGINKVLSLLEIDDLDELKSLMDGSEIGLNGISELKSFDTYLGLGKQNNTVEFDITLARGLSYYTGCIFEVTADDLEMGSLGGGGRYDDLTGIFGLKGLSGVGISFGAERIYDVMEELDLFPKNYKRQVELLLIAFDDQTHQFAYKCLQKLREADIIAELYPDPVKLKKQMKFANARNIPFVALVGQEEIETNLLSFKDMETGEQERLSLESIITKLKEATILI